MGNPSLATPEPPNHQTTNWRDAELQAALQFARLGYLTAGGEAQGAPLVRVFLSSRGK